MNRRAWVQDWNDPSKQKFWLGRNPDVMTDREVQVLKVAKADSRDLIAVLFDYPMHSTGMGTGNYLITGDVHGLAEQFIEKYLDGGVIAPAFAGASGNIDPWYRTLPKFKTGNGWVPETELMGTMLGEEVVYALESAKKASPAGPIKTSFKTLTLPRKRRDNIVTTTGGETREFNVTIACLGDVPRLSDSVPRSSTRSAKP